MKHYFNKLTALVGLTASLVLFADSASAGPNNLNITNYILSGQNLSGFPTNSVGTNGVYLSTGQEVPVFQQEHFGFNFQGLAVCPGTTNTIGILLCGSMAGNSANAYGTSNLWTSYTFSDFTTNLSGNGPVWIVMNVPAGTNWMNFTTNFPSSTFAADINYVGIFQITNYLSASAYVTNCAAYINKKLIPHPIQ